jgi:anti-sigma regulatory factor (Ser/Thr protein kinase)
LSGLLASDGTLDQAAQRQLLETADLEARRLHRLVHNLLSMTRLETGASTLNAEPCDLLDLVSAAVEELGTLARQRQVSFDIPEDLPLVLMDRELITHVLINLFSNAFKYSPPDQPVEIRGRVIDDELEVLIVDRGVGVPAENIGRVFDKFYRVAELGSAKGLGLGLAIYKAFIEAHGGRISLANNPMGGTIARFVIPLHAEARSLGRPWAVASDPTAAEYPARAGRSRFCALRNALFSQLRCYPSNVVQRASPRLRSPAGSGSGALPYAESWAIPPSNRSARFLYAGPPKAHVQSLRSWSD